MGGEEDGREGGGVGGEILSFAIVLFSSGVNILSPFEDCFEEGTMVADGC